MPRLMMAMRGTLTVALIAAILGLFGSALASPARAQEDGPEIVSDFFTIQGVVCEDSNLAGTYAYLLDVTYVQAAPENCRAATEGELTFSALDATDPSLTYDSEVADADGIAVLDVPVATEFYIVEAGDDPTESGSWTFTVPLDESERTPLAMTVIQYVAEPGVEPSPSPSGEPAPEADLTIQGLVCEDDTLAGTYEYLLDVTFSAAFPENCHVVGEGEHTYYVVDAATEEDLEVVATDAAGIATVDELPTDQLFWVIEQDDTETTGSEDIYFPSDGSISALNLTVIEYVSAASPELEPGTLVLDTMACTFEGPTVELVVLGPSEAEIDNAGYWDLDACSETEGSYVIYPNGDLEAEPIVVDDGLGGPVVLELPSTLAADGTAVADPHLIVELASGDDESAEFNIQEGGFTSVNVTYYGQAGAPSEEPSAAPSEEPSEEPTAAPTERPEVPTAPPSAAPTASPSGVIGLPNTGAGTTSENGGLTNGFILLVTAAGLLGAGYILRKRLA